jgi:hypothetical protein
MKLVSVFMLISIFSFISEAHAGLERGEAAPTAPNCSPDTLALVVGETTSFNSAGHPSAAKDARDMAAFLTDGGANVTLLIDKSKDETLEALKLFAAKQPEAVHLLYLSGTADENNGTRFVWFHLEQQSTGPDSENDSLRDAHAISVESIRDFLPPRMCR